MNENYIKLTPKMVLDLAAPHTWVASIFPPLLAICTSVAQGYELSASLALALLAISVLLQSATNAINDYFDFIKGADTKEDNLEASDSVLVYNNVNPKSALYIAITFVVIALALGAYCIYSSGPFCLIIALIGIAASFLYSGGKLPISYLPIGEAISGFVMGGLITYASYNVLTHSISPWILVVAIPLIINIALVMLTNNTSDIEKDIEANRKTLPVLLGRKKSVVLYKALITCSYAAIFLICLAWFSPSLIIFPFLFLVSLPISSRLFSSKFDSQSRIFSMGQICDFNMCVGTFYCLMVLASGIVLSF